MIEKDGVKHYCLVKGLSPLLSSQVSKHKGKHHFCDRCLNTFWYEKSLNKHLEYCGNYEAVKIDLPEKGTMLKFINYHRGEKVPFVVYADFECFIKSIQLCNPDDKSSYTKQYQKHERVWVDRKNVCREKDKVVWPETLFYYLLLFSINC